MRPAALGRLVAAELRGTRLRAMLLFVGVVALAAAAIVAGAESQTKASDRWDAAFAEANGAHVSVSGSPEAVDATRRLPEVSSSTHLYRRADTALDVLVDGEPVTGTLVRETADSDQPDIGRPLLRDGRWARPGTGDELVLDRAFGMEEGVDVGDRIALDTGRGPVPFTVVGRAVDLVDCLYPNCDPVASWVDPAGFDRLAIGDVSLSFLRLLQPGDVEAFVAELAGRGVQTNDWIDTRDDSLVFSEVFGAFLGAFGVFVMVAAAIVIAGSMATRAVARRRDIGLLKAVGTTPRQVTGSIVLTHVLAAALGVVMGWVVGGLLAPTLSIGIGDVLGAGGAAFSAGALVGALVVVEAIVVLATVLPAWGAGRVATTAALARVPGGRGRGRWAGRLPVALGAGPIGVAAVRDAFGRPVRSALTALALAVGVVAVLATIGAQRTTDHLFGHPELFGDPEEIRVYPGDEGADTIPQALDAEPGVASWFTETDQELVLRDETFLGVALGGEVARSGFVVREGRMIRRAGEAVAGWGLLDRFGLEVGARVVVQVDGRPLPLRIVGEYREGEDNGEVLRFPLAGLQRVGPDVEPGWASVNVGRETDADVVADRLGRRLGAAGHIERITTEGSDEVDAFRLAFLLVAGLVLVVAVTNLGSTMLLAMRERSHDLGVLRAVGSTPRQIGVLAATGGAALAAVACLAGVPLGWAVSSAVTESVGTASGIGPGIGVGPGVATAVILVPAALAGAAALGAATSRRAARAEVAELVRYE